MEETEIEEQPGPVVEVTEMEEQPGPVVEVTEMEEPDPVTGDPAELPAR